MTSEGDQERIDEGPTLEDDDPSINNRQGSGFSSSRPQLISDFAPRHRQPYDTEWMTGQGHDYDNPSSGFCAMDDRRDFGPIERSTPSHAFETKAGDPDDCSPIKPPDNSRRDATSKSKHWKPKSHLLDRYSSTGESSRPADPDTSDATPMEIDLPNTRRDLIEDNPGNASSQNPISSSLLASYYSHRLPFHSVSAAPTIHSALPPAAWHPLTSDCSSSLTIFPPPHSCSPPANPPPPPAPSPLFVPFGFPLQSGSSPSSLAFIALAAHPGPVAHLLHPNPQTHQGPVPCLFYPPHPPASSSSFVRPLDAALPPHNPPLALDLPLEADDDDGDEFDHSEKEEETEKTEEMEEEKEEDTASKSKDNPPAASVDTSRNNKGSCKVCENPESGNHYGVRTCEGCKGFFRRSTMNDAYTKFQCTDGKNRCKISEKSRCKKCRYDKCIQVGMNPEGVQKLSKQRSKSQEETSQSLDRDTVATNVLASYRKFLSNSQTEHMDLTTNGAKLTQEPLDLTKNGTESLSLEEKLERMLDDFFSLLAEHWIPFAKSIYSIINLPVEDQRLLCRCDEVYIMWIFRLAVLCDRQTLRLPHPNGVVLQYSPALTHAKDNLSETMLSAILDPPLSQQPLKMGNWAQVEDPCRVLPQTQSQTEDEMSKVFAPVFRFVQELNKLDQDLTDVDWACIYALTLLHGGNAKLSSVSSTNPCECLPIATSDINSTNVATARAVESLRQTLRIVLEQSLESRAPEGRPLLPSIRITTLLSNTRIAFAKHLFHGLILCYTKATRTPLPKIPDAYSVNCTIASLLSEPEFEKTSRIPL